MAGFGSASVDQLLSGGVAGCAVDGASPWEPTEEGGDEIEFLWTRTGDEVSLRVTSAFVLQGNFEGNDTSGNLTVSSIQENEAPFAGAEKMMEGAKRWKEDVELEVEFGTTSVTIKGKNVVLLLAKADGTDTGDKTDGSVEEVAPHELGADGMGGWDVSRCTVDEQVAWENSDTSDDFMSIWTKAGDDAYLFVESVFVLGGRFSRRDGHSGNLTVTSFEEENDVPDEARSMLEGAKRWKVEVVLDVQFGATQMTIRGQNVTMAFKNGGHGGASGGDCVKVAEVPKFAVQIVFRLRNPFGNSREKQQVLVRLDHKTLFSSASQGERATLLDVEAGKRLHVVSSKDGSRWCKFKIMNPSKREGERVKTCNVGKRWVAILMSVPMYLFKGRERYYQVY